MRTGTRRRWSNWGGNQTCAPVAVASPAGEDELVQLVKDATTADRRVKVVGAGHSFTPIACTDGVQVDMARYGRVLTHDAEARTVTVEAGITLRTLCDELDSRGLA